MEIWTVDRTIQMTVSFANKDEVFVFIVKLRQAPKQVDHVPSRAGRELRAFEKRVDADLHLREYFVNGSTTINREGGAGNRLQCVFTCKFVESASDILPGAVVVPKNDTVRTQTTKCFFRVVENVFVRM